MSNRAYFWGHLLLVGTFVFSILGSVPALWQEAGNRWCVSLRFSVEQYLGISLCFSVEQYLENALDSQRKYNSRQNL
jgi:hypothetical protein